MRWGGAGLIAAVLALAGCKTTDPKPADKDKKPKDPAGLAARTKGSTNGPAWLDEQLAGLPGAGTGVPKAKSWDDPKSPGFDTGRESKGLLAGRVLDPYGRGAKNVFIRIEPVDGAPKAKGAAVGITTDGSGYFMAKDLAPGRVYTLTAEAKSKDDGKPLVGVVQTRPPQPNLTIALHDDQGLPPPAAGVGSSTVPPAGTFPPPPSELIPSTDVPAGPTTTPARPAPTDGSWAPGTGATTGTIPATIGAPPTPRVPPPAAVAPPATNPGVTPPGSPSSSPPATPAILERTADGPHPVRPPVLSVPGGPPVPTLPLPSPGTPPPTPVPPPGPRSSRPLRPGANFTLVDTLDRPWEFATSGRAGGSLVLLDFLTSTCVPCKQTIPTLRDVQARYASGGLQLVGVLCDEVPQRDRTALAEKYQRDNGLNYAVYVEPGPEPGAVRDRFKVQSYPTVVLLGGDGAVLWQGHPGKRAELESAIQRNLGK